MNFKTRSYTGGTSITAGTLALSGSGSISNTATVAVTGGAVLEVVGRADQTLTLNHGQTLTGGGEINGKVNARPGSLINPGDAVGVLTIQSNLTLAGLLVMELNRTNSQPNDRINCGGVVTGGGTLLITNLGPALQAGDAFQLFNQPVSGFSPVILPQLVSPALIWTNTLGLDGTIRVLSIVSLGPVSLGVYAAGANIVLSWPADHTGWRLQSQTNNPDAGLGTNWIEVPDSIATNQISVPFDSSSGSVFFRLFYPQ
jgi:hypothetical protein